MREESFAPPAAWREWLRVVIFEADTPAGKAFDVALLASIVASIVVVMLDSVEAIRSSHRQLLYAAEWVFTGFFTLEYLLRLVCVREPLRYARSLFGIIDLLAILPTYLSLLLPGAQSLLVIRALRLLRAFRIFKLATYLSEANVLVGALQASRRKVGVFLSTVLIIALIVGSTMYLIEGPEHGFTSIPRAMYWAIVTVTTVGYGDIAPHTVAGQVVASILMIIGYCIIAVPTGIVSAELIHAREPVTTRSCPSCLSEGHQHFARFCRDCGQPLAESSG
jgi:voltage-gated potassium channel